MYKKIKKFLSFCMIGTIIATSVVGQGFPVTTVYATESIYY